MSAWLKWVVSGVLVALCLVIYAQTANHPFTLFDDDVYVTANYTIQRGFTLDSVLWAFTTGHAANWHPLTWLSLMLDIELFGMKPGPFHITNLVLHTLNSILLFWLFVSMTKAIWPSAFVAALFAVHPLHVESVAWVAERKDVLSTLFWILTTGAYFHYSRKTSVERMTLVAGLYALGLMAKPMLVTLPFTLLLFDYWPLGRLRLPLRNRESAQQGEMAQLSLRSALIEKAPLFLLAVGSCVVTFIVQREGGAVKGLTAYSLPERLMNVVTSYATYLGQMAWPARLSLMYPWPSGGIPWSSVAIAGGVLIGVTALVALTYRRLPFLAVGWLWYLGTLVPVIGLVQVGVQSHADRYTYVPLIGVFVMVAWGLAALCRWRPGLRWAIAGLGVVAVGGFTAQAHKQTALWANNQVLFEHSLAVAPSASLHNNMAVSLLEESRFAEAYEHIEIALRLDPNSEIAKSTLAKYYLKRGMPEKAEPILKEVEPTYTDKGKLDYAYAMLAMAKKQYEEAVTFYEKAFESNPKSSYTLADLSVALFAAGRVDEARRRADEAVARELQKGDMYAYLGARYGDAKLLDESVRWFQKYREIAPNNPAAYVNLAKSLIAAQRMSEARNVIDDALRLAPNNPEVHGLSGQLYLEARDFDAARKEYETALRLDPSYASAQHRIAQIYAALGMKQEALEALGKAALLNPRGVIVNNDYGFMLASVGRYEEAETAYRAAITADPAAVPPKYNLACLYALQGRARDSARMLAEAARLDPKVLESVPGDTDFDKVRNDPVFTSTLATVTSGKDGAQTTTAERSN